MEMRVGPQTPYEVYCYECRVTFPVGTRTCVHCGRPIQTGPPMRGPLPVAPGPAPDARDELELPPQLSGRKLGGMSLWALLVLGAALSRFCAGG